MKKDLLLLTYTLLSFSLFAQTAIPPGVVGDWVFHPNYTLARNAKNYPGQRIDPPKSRFQRFKTLGEPLYFYEQRPTERITDILEPSQLPQGAFTIEMWLLNHVNLPIGTLMTVRGKTSQEPPAWLLGVYDKEAVFHLQTTTGGTSITAPVGRGWKRYWSHLVGTYDGDSLRMFLNGTQVAVSYIPQGTLAFPPSPQLEVSGYFDQEPYMKISNYLKAARLHNKALSMGEIQERFEALQQQVETGQFFPGTFHFNAGPYLNYATPNSINLLWETDRMATALVEYGRSLPLDQKKILNTPAYIQEITLEDLEPETPYYYQITAIAPDGTEMQSGVLTFGTAVKESSAFSFCILGDTESRPHINHRLGEMIWEERPNFMVHLGDVTDGGFEPHKFEWNYEYFTGIVPVASRIPMFPVPGNGEGDLYWYNRYHRLPSPEAYYSFRYGNAEFFMLNSNANDELKQGGAQYEWLKEKLSTSTARWKFVAHHHCPVSSDENDFGDTWKGKTSTQGDPKFDDLKPLYESGGVDVVFYGHVHAYERSWPLKEGQVDQESGVIYIKSGGAGGHLEDFVPTHSWFSNKTQRGHHYCKVDIHGDTFSFKMYDGEGRMKDFLELKKGE